MNIRQRCQTATAIAVLFAAAGASAATLGKAEYSAQKEHIGAEYKADKAACKQFSGNAQDICEAQAAGKEKVARAELDYSLSGKPADANKVDVAKADAAYAVAKEKCDDLAGDPKSVCVTEAKAAHTKALADAKLAKKVGAARSDAISDKNEADYKVAREKCESLGGESQSACISAAKAQFGKS